MRWILIALLLSALGGCGSAPSLSSEGPPRCDRSGNEDQRRAC